MDVPLQIDVATLDAPHRRALEEIIGRQLATNQRLVVSVIEVEVPTSAAPRPTQTLEDWTHVYDGLGNDEIAEIEKVIFDRSGWTRNFSEQRAENSIAIQRASEMETPARQWLQHLLGRSLGDDEQVTIFVASVHAAPEAKDRQVAFQRMNRVLDQAAENMQDVPDAQFADAVDEAMGKVRKRPE